jgi:hypothetical protein
MTKQVSQLDTGGYFVCLTVADESPLEPGVFLMPAGTVDAPPPEIPEGQRAKWADGWVFEDIPQPDTAPEAPATILTYAQKRAVEYPPVADYLDAIVKGDQTQLQAYIDTCLAVKAKYPKTLEEPVPSAD